MKQRTLAQGNFHQRFFGGINTFLYGRRYFPCLALTNTNTTITIAYHRQS
jgi:hypothetical protein